MKQSSWMVSMLLIGILSACGASTGSAAGRGLPGQLVGSWYAGSGYTTAPYDPTTGQWGTPSGKGLVYVLRADGTYTKAFQSYNSNGGCTNGFTSFESGVAQTNGTQLYLHPTSGHMKVSDSCAPGLNTDQPIAVSDELFDWQMTADGLYLQRSDGASATFRAL